MDKGRSAYFICKSYDESNRETASNSTGTATSKVVTIDTAEGGMDLVICVSNNCRQKNHAA